MFPFQIPGVRFDVGGRDEQRRLPVRRVLVQSERQRRGRLHSRGCWTPGGLPSAGGDLPGETEVLLGTFHLFKLVTRLSKIGRVCEVAPGVSFSRKVQVLAVCEGSMETTRKKSICRFSSS